MQIWDLSDLLSLFGGTDPSCASWNCETVTLEGDKSQVGAARIEFRGVLQEQRLAKPAIN